MESKALLEKLKTQIKRPICRVCFTDIKRNSLLSFFLKDPPICSDCFAKMEYSLSKGKIDGVSIYSLGKYQGVIASLLIRYKETLDYELYPVFLSYYAPFIKWAFLGYSLVLVPSSQSKLKKRGFNHLLEIFKVLNMPVIDALYKDEAKEQKKRNALERKESALLFHLKSGVQIRNKKILLCDDVITSGTSIRTCLNLLKAEKPKKIKVLVLTNDTDLTNYS